MRLVFGTHSADDMPNSAAPVKLVYGHSNRPSCRLLPARALGVRHQAARQGSDAPASRAARTDFSQRVRRLRGGAQRVQWRERPRASAYQLSAEGAAVRAGQQPQGRVVAAAEAGFPGYQVVLVSAQEPWRSLVAELFRRIGGWRTAIRPRALH